MQCPIDRTPHTMAFDISVMVTLRERPSTATARLRLEPTTFRLLSENGATEGYKMGEGGWGHLKFYPYEKGGHAEGGGAKKLLM